jgi:hypothetical protein
LFFAGLALVGTSLILAIASALMGLSPAAGFFVILAGCGVVLAFAGILMLFMAGGTPSLDLAGQTLKYLLKAGCR